MIFWFGSKHFGFPQKISRLSLLRLNSIFLTEHNFSEKNKDKEIFGKYNAGFLAFKKDINGLEALKWWRKKCIYRCQFKATKHYFADQKYLNIFPKKFKKVLVLNH